jgi:hypothetical protein
MIDPRNDRTQRVSLPRGKFCTTRRLLTSNRADCMLNLSGLGAIAAVCRPGIVWMGPAWRQPETRPSELYLSVRSHGRVKTRSVCPSSSCYFFLPSRVFFLIYCLTSYKMSDIYATLQVSPKKKKRCPPEFHDDNIVTPKKLRTA